MTPPVTPEKTSPIVGRSRFGHNLLFLTKFFRHGTKIASVWPSSRFMALATLARVDWKVAKIIVELGAGTGPITAQIVERLLPQTRLLVIEHDPDFVKILQQRFAGHKNVYIIEGDVAALSVILRGHAIGPHEVDYFVSGLATPTLPDPVRTDQKSMPRFIQIDGWPPGFPRPGPKYMAGKNSIPKFIGQPTGNGILPGGG